MSAPGSSASPHDAEPAEALVRLLLAAGREEEAEQQRALLIRRLAEAGVPATAGAPRATRDPPAGRARTGGRSGEPAVLKQEIHFCTASDGTTLAYSVTGSGPPLVKAANWLNHLEADLAQPAVAALDPGADRRSARCGAMTSAATAFPTGTRR